VDGGGARGIVITVKRRNFHNSESESMIKLPMRMVEWLTETENTHIKVKAHCQIQIKSNLV
jgi:hypothetical protein